MLVLRNKQFMKEVVLFLSHSFFRFFQPDLPNFKGMINKRTNMQLKPCQGAIRRAAAGVCLASIVRITNKEDSLYPRMQKSH